MPVQADGFAAEVLIAGGRATDRAVLASCAFPAEYRLLHADQVEAAVCGLSHEMG